MHEFLYMRKKTRKEIKNGTSPCLQCPQLIKGIHMPERLPVSSITFEYCGHCNGRCSYCDIWRPENRERNAQRYQVYPVLKWLINRGYINTRRGQSDWGGGEPTLIPEFGDIMELLNKAGMSTFVNTNAILFSHQLSESLKNGRARIQVSLDSGNRETYIEMKGQDKYNEVVTNIKKYAFINPDKITLKYIINDKNNSWESLTGFLDLCREIRIKQVVLSPEYTECWKHQISEMTFSQIKLFYREANRRNFNVSVLWDCFRTNYPERIGEIV